MKQKTLFTVAAVALLLVFVVGTLLYKSERINEATQTAAANGTVLVRPHSPTLGNADAPVVIVEFFDPACETCRAFYPLVKQIMAANPGKIRLVLRYAPFHKGSDRVVAVLEAARKQDRYWPALEALLAAQAEWAPHHAAEVDLVWRHLQGVGLNLEQLRTDMNSPEIASLIAQDLADTRTLKVTKTPQFFVNSTPLLNFGYEPLKQLVDSALRDTQRR
jgi:hypothetical protein